MIWANFRQLMTTVDWRYESSEVIMHHGKQCLGINAYTYVTFLRHFVSEIADLQNLQLRASLRLATSKCRHLNVMLTEEQKNNLRKA